MSLFTFQRLQCLQSFTLSKDDNVFIYISKRLQCLLSFTFQKTSMSFARWQCLHLHFKDFNVFSHLRFQKTTMSSFIFQRLQCLQSFTLSKDHNVFIYISKDFNVFCNLHFKDINIFCQDNNVFIYISKTSMSTVIYAFKR